MKLFPFLMISTLFVLAACDTSNTADSFENDLNENQGIIGGSELTKTDPRRFYVAKLEIDRGAGSEGICTATQITEHLLLTAAHCFFDDAGKLVRNAGIRISYTSGSWKSETRTVKRVHIHSDYSKDKNADLAIVKIYGLAPDTQNLLPISFEKPQDPMFHLTSIGYGITNLRKRNDKDQTGLGTLRAVQTFSLGYLDEDRTIVIDQRSGKGINGGDSGGPAIYNLDGKPTVIGVARSVTPRKDGKAIVFDRQGQYTSTFAYKSWIMKTILAEDGL